MNRPRRGQSAIIGLVLLFGLVAIGSTSLFLIAGQTVDDSQQYAENERAATSFTELSHQMASVSSAGDTSSSLDLDVSDRGAVVLKNTSRMSIEYGNEEPTEIYFGTIEYEGEDGTRIAHQAGGVFRETGNETQVVSAPPVHYDSEPGSETLTFPIIEAADNKTLDSGDISISSQGTEDVYSEEVDGEFVTIEIEGPYAKGWKQYFEQQAGENSIEDYDDGFVEIKLGQSDLRPLYEYGAVASESLDPGSGGSKIHGPALYQGSISNEEDITGEVTFDNTRDLDPIDTEINEKIDDSSGNNEPEISSGEVTAGEYFKDGNLDISDDVDLNVEDGNITIVVDGDISVSGDITVTGTDNGNSDYGVRFYTSGDFELRSGGGGGNQANMCVEECSGGTGEIHSKHLEIYGTSDFTLEMSGGTKGQGVVYAPGENSELDLSGNQEWDGALILGTVDTNGAMEITHDSDLEGGPLNQSETSTPEITYLNIAKHEIELEN